MAGLLLVMLCVCVVASCAVMGPVMCCVVVLLALLVVLCVLLLMVVCIFVLINILGYLTFPLLKASVTRESKYSTLFLEMQGEGFRHVSAKAQFYCFHILKMIYIEIIG